MIQRIRKPVGAALTTAVLLTGAACTETAPKQMQSTEKVPKIDLSAVAKVISCVDRYEDNVAYTFGNEEAGRITVAACASMESCVEDDNPENVVAQVAANGSEYANEAQDLLDGQDIAGLAEQLDLRKCAVQRVYGDDGVETVQNAGQPPEIFYPRS